MKRPINCVVIALAVCLAGREAQAGSRSLVKRPLWVDRDDKDIPEPPKRDVSQIFDLVRNTWLRHLDPGHPALRLARRPALNVNAWDEVPDSSWFSNRIGLKPMTPQELLQGPPGLPPEPGVWRVRSVKTAGYTPGFQIRDSAGRRYFLKYDIPETPERNSAAERIGTLIMHAAGYNVPHNSIAQFRASDLVLDDKAVFEDALGRERPMTRQDIENAVSRLSPRPDGSLRGIASLFIPGKNKGSFPYSGTREDDPNDLIPHELRREIRGLGVIGSWFNHVDVKEENTFEAFVTEGDRHYLKHYFIDFGSSFGSGDFVNGPFRIGHEYMFDGSTIGRSLVTLGAWERPWEASCHVAHVEVGHFEAELFDPARWKPNYPNLAFSEMDDADAYWGAKIVTAFSDDLVRALAEAGLYTRPEVTRYMEETLRARRDKIGRCWFDRVTPLEGFELETEGDNWNLRFRDLALERGYADSPNRVYHFAIKSAKRLARIKTGVSREAGRLPLGPISGFETEPPDRWGRMPLLVVDVWTDRRDRVPARPVRVVIGHQTGEPQPRVLGWEHAPR